MFRLLNPAQRKIALYLRVSLLVRVLAIVALLVVLTSIGVI
ncbi:MAG TPA: hypothetical protein VEY07_08410 [Thermoplasmata archaeon]|nr:hypothetical protein [Thermoplasmata archaeon]